MTKATAWISAMRLRTLPLAISGIITGSFVAASHGSHSWSITLLSIGTATLLQILSNFANDYGDFLKGTDNDERVGPTRALQSGAIQKSEMKLALIITSILTFSCGLFLIWKSFGSDQIISILLFLIIGLLSIWAAIKYTVGNSAYGYHGLGDVFVFIFFGLVSVSGTYYLQTKELNLWVLIPATIIGFLSTGVLNLNNTRDIINDEKSNKRTLAVILGFENAKIYQRILFVVSFLLALIYSLFNSGDFNQLYWISCIPLFLVIFKASPIVEPKELDPLLKLQALGTLIFAITFGLGLIL